MNPLSEEFLTSSIYAIIGETTSDDVLMPIEAIERLDPKEIIAETIRVSQALDLLREQVNQTITKLVTPVRRLHNTAVPINSLPEELLIALFQETLRDSANESLALDETWSTTLSKLAQVCTLWRALIESSATLWSTLDLRDSQEVLERCMQMSRDAPLHVTCSSSVVRHSGSLCRATSKHLARGLGKVLQKGYHRWRSLRLCSRATNMLKDEITSHSNSFPLLQIVHLEPTNMARPITFENAPSLQTIETYMSPMVFSPIRSMASLTSLRLRHLWALELSALVPALGFLPALRKLEVGTVGSHSKEIIALGDDAAAAKLPKPILQNLQVLALSCLPSAHNIYLLTVVPIEQLNSIFVQYDADVDLDQGSLSPSGVTAFCKWVLQLIPKARDFRPAESIINVSLLTGTFSVTYQERILLEFDNYFDWDKAWVEWAASEGPTHTTFKDAAVTLLLPHEEEEPTFFTKRQNNLGRLLQSMPSLAVLMIFASRNTDTTSKLLKLLNKNTRLCPKLKVLKLGAEYDTKYRTEEKLVDMVKNLTRARRAQSDPNQSEPFTILVHRIVRDRALWTNMCIPDSREWKGGPWFCVNVPPL